MSSVSAEKAVRDWVAAHFPGAHVVTETPADFTGKLPVIAVSRFGGSSSYPTIDAANIDIEYFDSTRDLARDGSQSVRRAIEVDMPGAVVGGNTVIGTAEISAPTWTPYANTNVRRFNASYQITLHTD